MIRQSLVVAIIVCFVLSPSAFAGRWRDDFEDGNLGGWLVTGQATVIDGELDMKSDTPFTMRPHELTIGDETWRDYSAEVYVEFMSLQTFSDALPNGAGIGVRYQDYINSYFLRLDVFGNVVPSIWIGGNIRWLPSGRISISPGKWYRLRSHCQGDLIQFYLDDMLVTEVRDETYSSGAFNLWAYNCHVYFDDVLIEGNDIPEATITAVYPRDKLAVKWARIKQE